MKSVFIAGSRRFYKEIDSLKAILNDYGIKAVTTKKPILELSEKEDKKLLKKTLEIIAEHDIVYVFANNGYSWDSVREQIAFAHAVKKEVISSCKLDDYMAKKWVHAVMSVENLINYCKQ